jgi:hypothetical protein
MGEPPQPCHLGRPSGRTYDQPPNNPEEEGPVFGQELTEALEAHYAARKVPTEWEEITPDVMRPAFRMYFRALRSPGGDPDGARGEAEQLIHNPLQALRRHGLISNDETPHISTMVVNHEKTLERFIVYATVVVSNNPSTVGITLVKEEKTEEELASGPSMS